MLYGHPELTNDRKAPKALTTEIERRFPKIRVAWHNEFGCWVLLQAPAADSSTGVWDFLLVCNNPATGVPKEVGPWVLKWLEMNAEATEDLQKNVLDAQRKRAEASQKERAARTREGAERIARHVFPGAFKARESFAGLSAGSNVPPAAAYTQRESGLLVPGSGG